MPRLEYVARTLTGEEVRGRIRANSASEARDLLSARGYEVLEVQAPPEADAAAPAPRVQPRPGGGRRVSTSNLADFTSQLSLMLRTGTSLVESLEALGEQIQDPRLYNVIKAVQGQISGGSTLADAVAAHPRVFDAFYVSAVKSGEISGRLPDVFLRIEQNLRKRMEVRSALLVAMIYPAVVSTMALGAVIFVMTFVLPKFVAIFQSSGVALPLPTRMLMGMSGFITSYWYLLILLAAGTPILVAMYVRSPRGSRLFDGLILRAPIFGTLAGMVQTGLLLRTMGTLLNSGVPLVEGLDVARDACKNTRFKDLVTQVERRVTQGEDLASSISGSELLPPVIKAMLSTGERTGNMAEVMNAVADHLDDATGKQLKKMSAIIEPLIIIAMGIVVGFIAVSILMPLFRLSAAARGSG